MGTRARIRLQSDESLHEVPSWPFARLAMAAARVDVIAGEAVAMRLIDGSRGAGEHVGVALACEARGAERKKSIAGARDKSVGFEILKRR